MLIEQDDAEVSSTISIPDSVAVVAFVIAVAEVVVAVTVDVVLVATSNCSCSGSSGSGISCNDSGSCGRNNIICPRETFTGKNCPGGSSSSGRKSGIVVTV